MGNPSNIGKTSKTHVNLSLVKRKEPIIIIVVQRLNKIGYFEFSVIFSPQANLFLNCLIFIKLRKNKAGGYIIHINVMNILLP